MFIRTRLWPYHPTVYWLSFRAPVRILPEGNPGRQQFFLILLEVVFFLHQESVSRAFVSAAVEQNLHAIFLLSFSIKIQSFSSKNTAFDPGKSSPKMRHIDWATLCLFMRRENVSTHHDPFEGSSGSRKQDKMKKPEIRYCAKAK